MFSVTLNLSEQDQPSLGHESCLHATFTASKMKRFIQITNAFSTTDPFHGDLVLTCLPINNVAADKDPPKKETCLCNNTP